MSKTTECITNIKDLATQRAESIISRHPFFTDFLPGTKFNPAWINQLYWLSHGFTRAVAMRYAMYPMNRDKKMSYAFAQHAEEEVCHPERLDHWLRANYLFDIIDFETLTRATEEMNHHMTYIAQNTSPLVSSVVLNLCVETFAFLFYQETNRHLVKHGYRADGYWAFHAENDDKHAALGVPDFILTSCSYKAIVDQTFDKLTDMFSSWYDLVTERR